jgi:UrcA family protein
MRQLHRECSMETDMKRFFGVTAAILAAAAFAGTAQATSHVSQQSDAPSAKVKYLDSELTTYSGAQQVYGRIHAAAWRVCSNMIDANNPVDALDQGRCIADLVDSTVKDMNSPKLTAVYNHEEKGEPLRAPGLYAAR